MAIRRMPPGALPPAPEPVVVLIDERDWTARSLEGVLGPGGYRVQHAHSADEAAELLTRVEPDALFIDLGQPDTTGLEIHARLSDEGLVGGATPVIFLSPGRLDRRVRLEALARGAWDVLSLPLDGDELLLRLGTFVRVGRAAGRGGVERPDSLAAFYDADAVALRLGELHADAVRSGRALACLALGWEGAAAGVDPAGVERADAEWAEAVRRIASATRRCDVKGRLRDGTLVVLAPGTDAVGAHRLAQRLATPAPAEGGPRFAVGVFAEPDPGGSAWGAGDYLTQARDALSRAGSSARGTLN